MSESVSEPAGEERLVRAPVSMMKHDDGLVSMTFGPMPVEDLAAVIAQLGTDEGQRSFADAISEREGWEQR